VQEIVAGVERERDLHDNLPSNFGKSNNSNKRPEREQTLNNFKVNKILKFVAC